MLPYLIPLVIAAVLVVLIVLFVRYTHKRYEKLSEPENFVAETAPIEKTEASVVGMHIANEKRQDYYTPDHRTQYLVTFKLPDGTEKTLEVDESTYDQYALAQVGELITQNNHVLDFIRE